jgi:aminoglycoside 3-N-acetyltransferase
MIPHTIASLARDLLALGVTPGDLLFIHSSFKSMGPVEGGAGTVVGALEEAVGPKGLILMPSFNLVEGPRRAETWEIETTPSTVGWLTEYFRRMPGTVRSDHYSHSVAARGQGAEEFVSGHCRQEGLRSPWDLEPWGRTYGRHSPMYRAYEAGGKLLMLGVDYTSSTYVHLVEVLLWNRRLAGDSGAPYPGLDRPALGEFWDREGDLRRGSIGDAACRLYSIRAYVDRLLPEVDRNPSLYLR